MEHEWTSSMWTPYVGEMDTGKFLISKSELKLIENFNPLVHVCTKSFVLCLSRKIKTGNKCFGIVSTQQY